MSRRVRLVLRVGAVLVAAAVVVAAAVMRLATDPNSDTAECVVRTAGVPSTAAVVPCPEGAR